MLQYLHSFVKINLICTGKKLI